jgi:hypothetical protein
MAFFNGLSRFLLSFILVTAAASSMIPVKNVGDCSCGYYDSVTRNWFTESAIVYFNETADLPADVFFPQQYENHREKGWNTQFRQGASVSNVHVGKDSSDGAFNTSLELFVDPSTPDHLVVGGAVRTVRQDIFYGSFRMLLRSPQLLGSSLSMVLDWNDTQALYTNLQSTDDYSNAWVSMLNADEFQSRSLGVNYSILSNNTPPWNNDISPWNYTEYQVDWTPNQVNWTIGGKIFRQLNRTDEKFPQTPGMASISDLTFNMLDTVLTYESAVPLVLKHYSVGNWFSMQGPPANRSVANVGWVRLFFNSSLTTDKDSRDFGQRCRVSDACAMADTTLRGSTPYTPAATLKWKQIQPPRGDKEVVTLILIICGAVSFLLVSNALLRRTPWEQFRTWRRLFGVKLKQDNVTHVTPYAPSVHLVSDGETPMPTPATSRVPSFYGHVASPVPSIRSHFSRQSSMEPMNIRMIAVSEDEENKNGNRKSTRQSWREFSQLYREPVPYMSKGNVPSPTGSITGDEITEVQGRMYQIPGPSENAGLTSEKSPRPMATVAAVLPTPENFVGVSLQEEMLGYGRESPFTANTAIDANSGPKGFETRGPTEPVSTTTANLPPRKQRIDYLAGLIAFSCLLVTAIHFCLTFVPAAINPGAYVHYNSETWARKTISSYLLNLIWIGKFLFI